MDATDLTNLAERFSENRRFITNEETTKMALVVPFIRLLGYDPNNPREVRLEFTAEFTQGDGKKFADRMDYAIFDRSGERPLMVIEAKPLGADLRSKAQQLARYIAQMPDLHFGILTDGCSYLFFGDLENPNVMDSEPFFTFTLDDAREDWRKVADFLAGFTRERFNPETLVTDAEDARYRRDMTMKLAAALKDPSSDDQFMKWLSAGVYQGKRTSRVLQRLGQVAKGAVEPALLKVLGKGIADAIRQRFDDVEGQEVEGQTEPTPTSTEEETPEVREVDEPPTKSGIVTTEEELEIHRIARDICAKAGKDPEQVIFKDTTGYFNVSFGRPTKWFLRFFSRGDKRSIVTLVPIEEARSLCREFELDEPPPGIGASRVAISSVEQIWALRRLIVRSLEVLQDLPNGG
jgi:predicted type IV restriction endonuclease